MMQDNLLEPRFSAIVDFTAGYADFRRYFIRSTPAFRLHLRDARDRATTSRRGLGFVSAFARILALLPRSSRDANDAAA